MNTVIEIFLVAFLHPIQTPERHHIIILETLLQAQVDYCSLYLVPLHRHSTMSIPFKQSSQGHLFKVRNIPENIYNPGDILNYLKWVTVEVYIVFSNLNIDFPWSYTYYILRDVMEEDLPRSPPV